MLQMEPRNQQRVEHPDPRGGVSTCLSVGTSQQEGKEHPQSGGGR